MEKPTDEQLEAAAKRAYEAATNNATYETRPWDELEEAWKNNWRRIAGAVLAVPSGDPFEEWFDLPELATMSTREFARSAWNAAVVYERSRCQRCLRDANRAAPGSPTITSVLDHASKLIQEGK